MPETFFIAAQKLGGYLPKKKTPFVSFLLENSKSNTEKSFSLIELQYYKIGSYGT